MYEKGLKGIVDDKSKKMPIVACVVVMRYQTLWERGIKGLYLWIKYAYGALNVELPQEIYNHVLVFTRIYDFVRETSLIMNGFDRTLWDFQAKAN